MNQNAASLTKSTLACAIFTLLATTSTAVSAATYSVTELDANTFGVNGFSQALGNDDSAAVAVQNPFNQSINYDLLNFDNEVLQEALTDVDSARAGQPNDEDRLYLLTVLRSASGTSVLSQRLASYFSVVESVGTTQRAIGFDVEQDATQGLTTSNLTFVHAMLDEDNYAGSSEAPFYIFPYVNEDGEEIDYVINDHGLRGYASINGVLTALPPVNTTLGGISEAYDINTNLTVVGYSSTGTTNQVDNLVTNCEDDDIRSDQPVEACKFSLYDSNGLGVNVYKRATVWQLNSDGSIASTSTFDLPFTFERNADDALEVPFSSRARAINNAGLIVGDSAQELDGDPFNTTFAAVFADNTTVTFFDDRDQLPSTATDVNNNNIVVGNITRNVNGTNRTKFFVYDYNTQTETTPTDFFPGSASLAYAVNDNNIVVGEGEVETATSGARRRHGFMYDIDNDNFVNLNDTLACDSPYTIVSARKINNANVILADALVSREARNAIGDIFNDEDGNPVFIDSVISVLLNPIPGGELPDCSDPEADAQDNERQGAGVGLLFISLLAGVVVLRRRTQ